jgi:hypothetical protein
MKYLFVLSLFMLTACAGIQLEQFSYTTPDGNKAECLNHPTMEGYLSCTYMQDGQMVTFAVKKDLAIGE